MENTTNNFIQHYPHSDTAESQELEIKKEKGFRFVEPKINFPDNQKSIVYQEPEETPELTQAQWRRYYKKMGLQ